MSLRHIGGTGEDRNGRTAGVAYGHGAVASAAGGVATMVPRGLLDLSAVVGTDLANFPEPDF